MGTLADTDYLAKALEALADCKTELDLVNFDDRYCSNEQYMHLPTNMIETLEAEYRKRVSFVLGGLS